MAGPEAGFRRLLEVFGQLAIPYMAGGSLASSVHGVARATMDIDLVAEIAPEKMASLASVLSPDFYADIEQMRDAFQAGRAFNLIHHASGYKFDVFPAGRKPYDRVQFERRERARLAVSAGEIVEFFVASAEDTILAKLAWYRAGGEISQRQWNDVMGIVRTRGRQLDSKYLREWAGRLGIGDLLARVLDTPIGK